MWLGHGHSRVFDFAVQFEIEGSHELEEHEPQKQQSVILAGAHPGSFAERHETVFTRATTANMIRIGRPF